MRHDNRRRRGRAAEQEQQFTVGRDIVRRIPLAHSSGEIGVDQADDDVTMLAMISAVASR